MNEPPRSNCMLMPALPRAVGHARAYTRWVLGRWQLHTLAETVELLVSELVTNAITATGSTDHRQDLDRLTGKVALIHLCISAQAETVLVEVWDTSGTPPLKRAASDDDEAGRGLTLVQALSKEWGFELLDTGGKIVWATCLHGDAI